jgi:hypothetical protein
MPGFQAAYPCRGVKLELVERFAISGFHAIGVF